MNTLKFFCYAPDLCPKIATSGSAGLDLRADKWTTIEKGQHVKISTGVVVEIPDGYVGFLLPRSSLGAKGLKLVNTIGVIDSDYRGEIMAIVENISDVPFDIDRGERFVQLVVVPCPQMKIEEVELNNLSDTERGDGGFGSTGK